MKTIAMIMTLAAGLSTFGLAASAENSTKEPVFKTARAARTSVVSQPMSGTSAFLPMSETQGKQPAWVTYGSLRQ